MDRVLTDEQYQEILRMEKHIWSGGNRGYNSLLERYTRTVQIVKMARVQFPA